MGVMLLFSDIAIIIFPLSVIPLLLWISSQDIRLMVASHDISNTHFLFSCCCNLLKNAVSL